MQITALRIITVIYLPPPIGSRVDYRSKARLLEPVFWQPFSHHYSVVCLNWIFSTSSRSSGRLLHSLKGISVHADQHVHDVLGGACAINRFGRHETFILHEISTTQWTKLQCILQTTTFYYLDSVA